MGAPTYSAADDERQTHAQRQQHRHNADSVRAVSTDMVSTILNLQRTIGNGAVNLLLRQYARRQATHPFDPGAQSHDAERTDDAIGSLDPQGLDATQEAGGGSAGSAVVQRIPGKHDRPESDDEESESEGDEESDADWDPNDEPPEPVEPLELVGVDPLYRRSWSSSTKTWAKAQLRRGATCPCGQPVMGALKARPGQRAAKQARRTGTTPMRVDYDIDHHTIKWADRVSAMQAIEMRTPGTITRDVVVRVHNSKLRLMHDQCNVSHQYEPRAGAAGFRLQDYDGTP